MDNQITLNFDDFIAILHARLIEKEPCSFMEVHQIIDKTADEFIKDGNRHESNGMDQIMA